MNRAIVSIITSLCKDTYFCGIFLNFIFSKYIGLECLDVYLYKKMARVVLKWGLY